MSLLPYVMPSHPTNAVLALLISGGLHAALFLVPEPDNVRVTAIAVDTDPPLRPVDVVSEDPPPPPPSPRVATQPAKPGATEPERGSLGEPPPTVVEQNVWMVLTPTRPVPPDPSRMGFTVPVGPATSPRVGADMTVIDSKDLDRQPRAVAQTAPRYPLELERNGVEGVVTLQFVVRRDGTVGDPVVVRSTHPGFDASAIAAVLRWRFSPGERGGRKVNSRMELPITFRVAR